MSESASAVTVWPTVAEAVAVRPREPVPAVLRVLVGCRVRTHYGTGGTVMGVTGPWDYHGGCYSITYTDPRDGHKCWINTIRVEDEAVTCEHKPLVIEGREKQAQISLF